MNNQQKEGFTAKDIIDVYLRRWMVADFVRPAIACLHSDSDLNRILDRIASGFEKIEMFDQRAVKIHVPRYV